MIVLINLNSYLGGGETLMVRMAQFLSKTERVFCCVCARDGYIHKDLINNDIRNCIALEKENIDYYYMNDDQRLSVLSKMKMALPASKEYTFVTFLMRDLYMVSQLTKEIPHSKVVHLVLHYQDNLYVSQSVKDKFVKRYFHKEKYSRKRQIAFNKMLFNKLCDNDAIIPMGDLMVNYWTKCFDIHLKSENVVSLPTADFPESIDFPKENNHKIIFIGRIVDFKIPALCVMLNYINRHKEYSLTVVGDGDMLFIDNYIEQHHIDRSRIHFIGQVDYNKLGNVIKEHSIGYAMGTSVIEICKQGLPAVMALSNPNHKLYERDICGGLYANCVRGNVGDNLFAGESQDDQPLLEDVMTQLENNYEASAKACYEYIKSDYGLTHNMNRYLEIIVKARSTDFSDVEIPHATCIRKFLFKHFN